MKYIYAYKSSDGSRHEASMDAESREAAACRQRRAAIEQERRKLFTAFPATHRTPDYNK